MVKWIHLFLFFDGEEDDDDDDDDEDEEGVTEGLVDFTKKLRIESFSWTVEWLVLEVVTLS